MKAKLPFQVVDAHAAALVAGGAQEAASLLRQTTEFLSGMSNDEFGMLLTMGQTSRRLAESNPDDFTGHPAAVVAIQLDHLAKVLSAAKANPDWLKTLESLSQLLWSHRESESLSATFEKLRATMIPHEIDSRIAEFSERLKNEIGTPDFERTIAALDASDLTREQVVAVAMSVYGSVKKSTARRAALGFIRKLHSARMSAKRGIEATGGRSAA